MKRQGDTGGRIQVEGWEVEGGDPVMLIHVWESWWTYP